MKLNINRGDTSKLIRIFIPDSSVTDGSGLTGLVFNSAGLSAHYIKDGEASPTAIVLVTATVGTWVSGGFIEIDSVNMPGWYEIGVPNAALDSGEFVGIHFEGAVDMAPVPVEIELIVNLAQYEGAAWYSSPSISPALTTSVLGRDGTPRRPNTDWESVYATAIALGTWTVMVMGTLDKTSAVGKDYMKFKGWSNGRFDNSLTPGFQVAKVEIDLGQNYGVFEDLEIYTGPAAANFNCSFIRCTLTGTAGNQVRGYYFNCSFHGISHNVTHNARLEDCFAYYIPTFAFVNLANQALVILGGSMPGCVIEDMQSGHSATIDATVKLVTIDSSCVGGQVTIFTTDPDNVTDNSGAGCTVIIIAVGEVPTAQEIRDAMKLAPSGGAPAAGSVDQHLDDIEADTNEIQGKLPSKSNLAGTNNADGDIEMNESTGNFNATQIAEIKSQADQSLVDYDSSGGVAKETSVNNIQNNTRFSSSPATPVQIPEIGNMVMKISCTIFNTDGSPEDPDDQEGAPQVAINAYATNGQSNKTDWYEDATLVTPGVLSTVYPGHYKMVKVSTGRFELYYALPNTEDPDNWVFTFRYMENGVQFVQERAITVVSEVIDGVELLNNNANKDVIIEALKNRDASPVVENSTSIVGDLKSHEYEVDVVKFNGQGTIYGLTLDMIQKLNAARVAGRFKKDTPGPGDISFYEEDNNTVFLIMNNTGTERTRVSGPT